MGRYFVRRGAARVAIALVAAMAACGDEDPTGPVLTTSVTVGPGNTFNPPAIQVSPGATVTWTWSENMAHNVTFGDASITDIGSQTTGSHSTDMPNTPGTYAYQCTFHSGMTGSVVVQ